jgi:hypothetical protein
MRRKERYIANAALIGSGVTALGDILIQWMEHSERGEKFTWDSYDGTRTLKNSLKGGLFGAGAGYIYYEFMVSEESKFPFNSDEYLKAVLTEESLRENPGLLENVKEFRERIKLWLENRFGDKLVNFPEDTGSFIKGTAISSNFDLDIILPFKFSSFSTLEEMYNTTYDLIYSEFGNKAKVTKQTRAIGLTFEKGGEIIHFDIVPGREINNYMRNRDLNLYVRPDWAWQKGGSFKTNVFNQKNMTVNKPEERRVIRLLKVYKNRNELPLPTIIIEQSVVEALSDANNGVSSSDTENLLNSMDFIAKRLEQNVFLDHSNTNNNLNNKITSYQRGYIVHQLYSDIKKIEDNPRYIKEIFEL